MPNPHTPDREGDDPTTRRHRRPRRRLDPDEPPFDQLHVPIYTDGRIQVIRGTFDIDELSEDNRLHLMSYFPDVEHVVFTNRIGQHEVIHRGWPLDIGVDPTRPGRLPDDARVSGEGHATLAEYTADIRETAQRMRAAADQLDAMAADGWELVPDTSGEWAWPLHDTKPGPSFAPLPRRRKPRT